MDHIPNLISDLTIMLGAASIVVLLFQRIHQPVVLGYLVAGMIVGPHTPPHSLVSDATNIQTLSELGVIFLMFSLGLEFSFHKLTRVGSSAFITGLIEVILMIFIGYGVGRLLGWPHFISLFLGAALSISSTTIIIKAIDELDLKSKSFSELVFGVLIVEDLLAILLLVALSTIVMTNNIFSFDMVNAIIRLILVVGSWFIAGYFILPPLFNRIASYINDETLTIIAVALCLLMVSIATNFRYSTALGAFIMGSILAETVVIRRIEHVIKPIRDIFAAVFFISIGMLIDPRVIIMHWSLVLFLSTVTIIGKVVTTTFAAILSGQRITPAMQVGFSMAQIGEFSFIIIALGQALGVTNNIIYPVIVAVSGITTFTTPYLIRLANQFAGKVESNLPMSWQMQFKKYDEWLSETKKDLTHKAALRKIYMRMVVNGIIITIIFILFHYFAFHWLNIFDESSSRTNSILLLCALLWSSPFIWGMLHVNHNIPITQHTRELIFRTMFLTQFITLMLIGVLSILFFYAGLNLIFIFMLVVLFFVLFSQRIANVYNWFEQNMTDNMMSRKKSTRPENKS